MVRALAEDYFEQIAVFSDGRITHFTQSPIRLFILPPPEEHAAYVDDCRWSIQQWEEALPDVLQFQEVPSAEEAHIQIRWASYSLNQTMDHALGDAQLIRENDESYHVEITASLRDKRTGDRLTHEEMRTVFLHELGHALGLWGHSPYADDLMFYASEALAPTARDIETMRRVYATPNGTSHHDASIAVIQGWLTKTPDVPRFHYLLGCVYQDAGNDDAAIDAFLRCLELDMSYKAAGDRLVEAYKRLGRTTDAVAQAERLIQVNPSPETYNTAGGLAYEQGDLDTAVARFRQALELDPRYRPARRNLFSVLRDQANQRIERGEYALALELAQEALRLEPTDAQVLVLLGIARSERKEFQQAIACYEEALKYHPEHGVARENIGRTYNNWAVQLVREGKYREAIEKYRAAQKACPDMKDIQSNLEDAYWRMAGHQVDAGQWQEGIATYRELLSINPSLTEIHAIVGGIYYQHEAYAEALEAFKAALNANPDMPEARHNLFVTHIRYGQKLDAEGSTSAAIEHFRQAIQIQPASLDAHRLLAQAYRHANRMEEALATLEKASTLDPTNEQIRKSIANVYIQRGNQAMRAKKYREAIEAFEGGPESQKSVDIYNTIAYLYISAGDFLGAFPSARQVMKRAPKDAIVYQNLLSIESYLDRQFDPRPGKERPGTRDRLALAHAEVARCLMGREEISAAVKKLEAAYDLKPTSEPIRKDILEISDTLLGKLQEHGWTKSAGRVATWILDWDPQNARAQAIR